MTPTVAFVFPGQGSQHVGMGRALAEAYPEAGAALAEADAAFSTGAPDGADTVRSLTSMIFDGPDDQLTLTEHAQPAILAVSVAAYRVLAARGIEPAFVAGHSLGEYSAHVASGTMSLADGVSIVRRRGRFMQDAVPVGQGAMAAILGADTELVRQACLDAADGDVVSAANLNAPGQVVIAGHAGAVRRASERAKALGARKAVPLTVSAPFHCSLMKAAQDRLEPELRSMPVHDPRITVIANVDAEPKRTAAASIDALVQQVSSPVRWQESIARLYAEGVRTFVEVGPGSALSGMIRRIQKDAQTVSFGTPEDLDAVLVACSN